MNGAKKTENLKKSITIKPSIRKIPNTKCPNCLERKMVEDDKFGEQLKEVEAVEVMIKEKEGQSYD